MTGRLSEDEETMKRNRGLLIGMGAALGFTAVLAAQRGSTDWPQWRGPNRDGAAGSFSEPKTWPERLTMKWKVEVGLGYSMPIAVGNRVYAFSREEPNEVMRALDADTGKVIWKTSYPAPYKANPAATRRHGTGPKSTPAFANGRLFTLGMSGIVTGFDAATGRQLWQTAAPTVEPLYHTAMSPLVDGALVIVHVGGHDNGALTAFDVNTGGVKWSWRGDGPSYGSPVMVEIGGRRQIVTLTQQNLIGVSAASGELLWQRPFVVRSTRNAVTPILYGQTIIVSGLDRNVSAFAIGTQGIRWTTIELWENDEVTMDMSTGVLVGNAIYGFSPRNSGQFFAIDAKTGKTLWLSEGRQAENAAVVRAGNLWLALENDGELVVNRADPARFEPLRRYSVADSETWAAPVLSGNRVFVKDLSSVALWTLN
jgi:outer membrane protein assembly factor BamB